MEFKDAILHCHVSGSIYRKGNPTKKYGKNHTKSLEYRVPKNEQKYNDWCEYDSEQEYGHY